MPRLAIALVLEIVLVALTSSAADAGDRIVLDPDGKPIQLTTTFGKRATAQLVAGGKSATLYTGAVEGALAAGHGRVIVALATSAARDPFRIHVIEADVRGEPVAVARPGTRRDDPFAVAITATVDGFAVFFQEVERADPTAAHTYLVELDAAGVPGPAREVAVPWALLAAVDNGNGYHLALSYPGDASGMRLSMVSLSAAGSPEQHPDWASAGGFISDVHLVAAGGKIRAFYRGGKSGNRVLESDVTVIRSWGTEPPKALDHGAITQRQAIAITKDKPTKLELRRR